MEILKGRIHGKEIVFDPPLDPAKWPNGQEVIIYLEGSELSETQSRQIKEAKEAAIERGETASGDVRWGLVRRVEAEGDE